MEFISLVYFLVSDLLIIALSDTSIYFTDSYYK